MRWCWWSCRVLDFYLSVIVQWFWLFRDMYPFSRFTARASASSLLHIAYPRVNDETKTEMFNSFITLCKDETPLVRRVAADNVVHWSEWASTIEMQNELIAILKICIVDEQVTYVYLLVLLYFSYDGQSCWTFRKLHSYWYYDSYLLLLLFHRIPSESKLCLSVSRLQILFLMRWRYNRVLEYYSCSAAALHVFTMISIQSIIIIIKTINCSTILASRLLKFSQLLQISLVMYHGVYVGPLLIS